MNYLQMLAAYNTLESKLLAKAFIKQNMHQLDPHMLYGALLDFRLYNPHMTFKENRKVKLDLAKQMEYLGTIILGNIDGKMIYKHEVIEGGVSQMTYYPDGFQKTDNEFNFVYKFSEGTYTKIVRSKLYRLFQFILPYKTAQEKFAKLYNTVPTIKHHVNLAEYIDVGGEEGIKLTIVNPESKIYVITCLISMGINYELKKEGVLVWSK